MKTEHSSRGILKPDAAQEKYTLKHYEPTADLAPFVERYWIVRWDIADAAEFTTEILPNPSVNATITSESCDITGVHTGKFTYTLRGNGIVVGVKFLAGGFYPIYKKSIDKITNNVIPMSQVWSATRIKKIVSQLDKSDEVLVAEVEKLLRSKKPVADPVVEAVGHIITQATEDATIRSIADAAEVFETSERTLQHTFQRYVGVGLKWIINRYRLQDVAREIDNGNKDWTHLAHSYGFADQSHLIKDFKKVMGETPAQYAERLAK